MIQMVNLKAEYQALQSEIDSVIKEVLESGYFIGGPKVTEFSDSFAQFMEVDHVIPCANGTDALQIAFMALGLQPGDEIIIPAFTYVAPAEAALLLGCKPVFVDIDSHSYCLDVKKVEESITEKTKCIVPVHLFGQSTDMTKLMKVAKQHQLFVVEDNAQATGARHQSIMAGTFGHFGTTSFFPSKNLGCYGDGGAIMTNDEQLAKQAKQVASHGQSGKKFYHDTVGINSRLDTLQAAILSVKLPYLNDAIIKRRAIASRYLNALTEIDEIVLPDTATDNTHTFHQFVMRLPNGKRDAFREYMKTNGVSTGVYYPYALPDLPPYHSEQSLPVSQQLVKSSVAIPISPYLTEEEQELIITKIKGFSYV